MGATYVYADHSFGDVYMIDHELSRNDLYCPECDKSDELLYICQSQEELDIVLEELLKNHDLCPCDEYDELILKYRGKGNSNEEN